MYVHIYHAIILILPESRIVCPKSILLILFLLFVSLVIFILNLFPTNCLFDYFTVKVILFSFMLILMIMSVNAISTTIKFILIGLIGIIITFKASRIYILEVLS